MIYFYRYQYSLSYNVLAIGKRTCLLDLGQVLRIFCEVANCLSAYCVFLYTDQLLYYGLDFYYYIVMLDKLVYILYSISNIVRLFVSLLHSGIYFMELVILLLVLIIK